MIRRSLLSAAAALLGTGALASVAMAGDEWCPADPAVVVRTPGGNTVVVHVTLWALGAEHQAALRDAAFVTTATAAPGSTTDVEIQVTVPDDAYATGFPTRAVASTQPWEAGTVLARDEGKSGKPMKLRFRLDVP